MKAALAGKDMNLQIECAVLDQVRDMTCDDKLETCTLHIPRAGAVMLD
jgi:hypothetical protein